MNHLPFQATLNQMLSAIFLRMESKTVEIEELDKSMLEVKNYSDQRMEPSHCVVYFIRRMRRTSPR